MKRGALIIVNPGDPAAQNYCRGVCRDRDHYRSFLQEPYGGLWDSGEIEVLEKPAAAIVRREIKRLGQCDYSVVIFSGHGYYSTKNESTILEPTKGEYLDSKYLIADSPKQLVVLDCCREPDQPMTLTEELRKSFAKAAVTRKLNPRACRRFYEEAIWRCPNEVIMLFGCAIGERAGGR